MMYVPGGWIYHLPMGQQFRLNEKIFWMINMSLYEKQYPSANWDHHRQ